MSVRSTNKARGKADPAFAASINHSHNALVVEPDHLLRWSLVTYLGRWFHMFPAQSLEDAALILESTPIDAVVISSEFARSNARELARRAVATNSNTRVVKIVTSSHEDASTDDGAAAIEKPFELAALARLLGVTEDWADGSSPAPGPLP